MDINKLATIKAFKIAMSGLYQEEILELKQMLDTCKLYELVNLGIASKVHVTKQEVDKHHGVVILNGVITGNKKIHIFKKGEPVIIEVKGHKTFKTIEDAIIANTTPQGYEVRCKAKGSVEGRSIIIMKDPNPLVFETAFNAISFARSIKKNVSENCNSVKDDEFYDAEDDETVVEEMSNQLIQKGAFDEFEGVIESLEKLAINTPPAPGYEIVKYMVLPSNDNRLDKSFAYDTSIIRNDLNEYQYRSVKYSLENKVSLIHGPPGTGKSKTLAAIVEALLAMGEKVLVCSASHVAVDSLVSKIIESSQCQNILRLGHPCRIDPALEKYSVRSRMMVNQRYKNMVNHVKSIARTLAQMDPESDGYPERLDLLNRAQEELMNLEQQLLDEFIRKVDVVAGTLVSVRKLSLPQSYTTVIIDEVSQCMIPYCYIPAIACMYGYRLVAAGDDKQLAPTVKSQKEFIQKTLSITFFTVLMMHHTSKIKNLLRTQYRMSHAIMQYPSNQIYNGLLVAHESVRDQRLCDLPYVKHAKLTQAPIVWFDTVDQKCYEQFRGFSKGNKTEASMVRIAVEGLVMYSGVPQENIGVITPYAYQRQLIINELSKRFRNVEVSSIDGFQGREKEIIILSMVKSEGNGSGLNFVGNERRLNVAITRPKRMLFVVGNSKALRSTRKKYKFITGFTDNCLKNGYYLKLGMKADGASPKLLTEM